MKISILGQKKSSHIEFIKGGLAEKKETVETGKERMGYPKRNS